MKELKFEKPEAKARKRGGPSTALGKIVAAKNAIAHGASSEKPFLLPHESEAEFKRHHAGTLKSLAPRGTLEMDLAETISWTTWRLKRIREYEMACATYQARCARRYANAIAGFGNPPEADEIDVLRAVPDGKALDKIVRYESHISRQLGKSIDRLAMLQQNRRARKKPSVSIVQLNDIVFCKTNPAMIEAGNPQPTSRNDKLRNRPTP
jgi:hypothetical protein